MADFLLHVGLVGMCPHGGQIQVNSSNTRVKVAGQAAATVSDMFTIIGCPFTIPPVKPQPCIKILWLAGASRVKINGQPAVLKASTGLCQSPEQIPQGPPNILSVQARVKGI